MTQERRPTEILVDLDKVLPELEAIYKDIHAHPELSMLETRAGTKENVIPDDAIIKLNVRPRHRPVTI
jgi:metal-dependent amidase/aminoacylase/carboxypeptidase family protein